MDVPRARPCRSCRPVAPCVTAEHDLRSPGLGAAVAAEAEAPPCEERMTFSMMEGNVATADRGFASMDREKQREIASKGGRAAHHKGTAHEWTPTEAREAGRKGGMASRRKRTAEAPPPPIDDEFDGVY